MLKINSFKNKFIIHINLYTFDKENFDFHYFKIINTILIDFRYFFKNLEKIQSKQYKIKGIKYNKTKYSKTSQYITVIRSPHKYKDSREQFNSKIFFFNFKLEFSNKIPFTLMPWIEKRLINKCSQIIPNGISMELVIKKPYTILLNK